MYNAHLFCVTHVYYMYDTFAMPFHILVNPSYLNVSTCLSVSLLVWIAQPVTLHITQKPYLLITSDSMSCKSTYLISLTCSLQC